MPRNEERLPARQGGNWGLSRHDDWMSPSSLFTASPWQMMRRMQEDMDRVFSQFIGGSGMVPSGGHGWAPRVDVSETDREWRIEADLPGVSKDEVQVEVHGGHLVLRAETRREHEERPNDGERSAQPRYLHRERHYGFFQRMLPLPGEVDQEAIRCEFNNGVLTVHVPKTEPMRSQGRRIPIQDAEPLPAQAASSGPGTQSAPGRNGDQARKEPEPAVAGRKGGEASSRRGSKA
jgi:HSP20 family protein